MKIMKTLILGICLYLSGCAQSHLDIFPDLADPTLMERKIPVAALHQDIDAMIAGVQQRHPDYAGYADTQALERTASELKASIVEPLTRVEFFRKVGQLSHLFNDGHSFLLWPYQEYAAQVEGGAQPFPFRVKTQDNGLFLASDYQLMASEQDVVLAKGTRVVSINGIAAADIVVQGQRYVGGETRGLREAFFAERFPQMVWAVFGMIGRFELELQHGQEVKSYTLTSKQQWQAISDLAATNNVALKLLDATTAYLQVSSFDVDPDDFSATIAAHFATLKRENIEHLIIDIRDNTGGNTDTATELASYLAKAPFQLVSHMTERLNEDNRGWFGYKGSVGEVIRTPWTDKVKPKAVDKRFNGNVYVLISPVTYSAAIVFATTVQDNQMALLAGEPTGGFANQTAQGNLFNLPHSQLRAYVATRMLVRPSGASGAAPVIPDIAVKPNAETGQDAVVEKIKELLQ